jgi:simple sugar transport system permease protein
MSTVTAPAPSTERAPLSGAEQRRRALAIVRRVAPFAVPLVLYLLLPAFGINQQDALVRATPFVLTALAVAVPARAGLVNVGGEGQLFMGAAGAAAVAFAIEGALPGAIGIPLVMLGGAAGGMAWMGVAALLRLGAKVNEVIATLLLNYVAASLLAYLVFSVWRDPGAAGEAISPELHASLLLPTLGPATLVNYGIFVAIAAVALVWLLVDRSRWGFRAGVVGGNPEAARRAGMPVTRTLMVALLVGGALAGLAGAIELMGIETRLRTGIGVGFGYIGFLASWMVGHRPAWIVSAGLLLAGIAVYGDTLQIEHNLPARTVYIVMAGVLLVVLSVRGKRRV